MMLTIQDISSHDRSEWEDFILYHSTGTLFHRSTWLDILTEFQQLVLIKIGFFENDILVGAFPLFIKSLWPIRIAASPFVVEDTPYMGLVIDADRYFEALELLGPFMKKNGIHFLRIIQRQSLFPEVQMPAFQIIEKHTHLLDLTKSEDKIWSSFEGRCRTAIRKAEKSGVRVKLETCREAIESYYEILDELYAGQKMTTPNPKQFYYRLWDAFSGDQLYMLTAWHDETLISGAFIMQDSDRCYYLNGASRPEYLSIAPNNLIQWEAIRLAKSRGAVWYDFVGSDIERLAKFKKSFGGDLVTYACLEKSTSAAVSFIRKKYPVFKIALGRLKKRFGITA